MSAAFGSVKSAVRTAAAQFYHASGLHQWRHRGKAVIVMYHRVLTPGEVLSQAVQPGMYVHDTVFAQHMSFLKNNFTVVSLQDLLDMWKREVWNDRQRYCVITFDDGWLDNYHHAYPILKKLNIPATIFLPTDYVGSREWFWPDQVAYICRALSGRRNSERAYERFSSVLARHGGQKVGIASDEWTRPGEVADRVIEWCKRLPIESVRELVAALVAELDVMLPEGRVIVNWDEVREMSAGGLSFGSHSCSHRIMTTISPDLVWEEVARSRQVLLEQRINYVSAFCYPNGNSDPTIQDQVQTCGYEAAVGVQMGVEGRKPQNRYALRRIGIHNDITNTIPLFCLRLFGPVTERH
ncbi:hypothetical protein FBQ96_00475 [Nitrospirales bacterium NOB]|nr:hypothetical protein [Nitrospirales bacterium NOB]